MVAHPAHSSTHLLVFRLTYAVQYLRKLMQLPNIDGNAESREVGPSRIAQPLKVIPNIYRHTTTDLYDFCEQKRTPSKPSRDQAKLRTCSNFHEVHTGSAQLQKP